MSEFSIIRRLLRDAPALRNDVIVGPGDDGAVLSVPAGHELVLTTDTLINGRHFPVNTAPADIGWKALAVNISDLAAMGAAPAWITIALSLPEDSEQWMAGFVSGLSPLLQSSGASLVGGDLTQGPLTITVQAAGLVPAGQALRRGGARVGDKVCVTGDIGDAALGLLLWQQTESAGNREQDYLRQRLTRPPPRHVAGCALRGKAHAAVDLSDGFAADLGHMLDASQVGARIFAEKLPSSPAFDACCRPDQRLAMQLNGGDDYELCVAVPEAHIPALQKTLDCKFSVVGEITSEPGLALLDGNHQPVACPPGGYDHFT